jgi:hypothetical protein
VAGDDRSPPWAWQTYLYSSGEYLAIPSHNLMVCLRYAATKMILKGSTSFKGLSQAGIFIESEYCDLYNDGKKVPVRELRSWRNLSFADHSQKARDLGFSLFVKRATIPKVKSKHVRVRAKFDAWSTHGRLVVSEPAITTAKLVEMFDLAGRIAGLMDWRPGSPNSPGSYGMFDATVRKIA